MPTANYNIGRIYQTRLNDTPLAKKYFKNYLLFADTATPDKKKVYRYVHQWYSTNKRQ